MKRIENPQILNRIFELLQKELGVDAKTNQPFLCVDKEIECDDCAFELYTYINSLVRRGDIMTRFERDKEVLFDLLAEDTGVGIGDNKIYFCRELYCDDCLMNSACHKSINEAVGATHKWITTNFEKQHEDIMDYIYDTIAVDKWDNYAKCNLLSCRNCLFDKYDSCTELKKEYLNEEV